MMGCAGDPVVRTPHIDRLAAEGTRFTDVHVQGPLCMPARASFLTERYVRDHGVFENGSEVAAELPTFLHSLRAAGYHNVAIGKTHLWMHNRRDVRHADDQAGQLRQYGFDEALETVGKVAVRFMPSRYSDALQAAGALDRYQDYISGHQKVHGAAHALPAWHVAPCPVPPELYADTWLADRTVAWIEQAPDRPFFLQVGFSGPHDPWDAPEDAVNRYADADIPLPASVRPPDLPANRAMAVFLQAMMNLSDTDTMTDERIVAMRRAYYANISLIDAGIGRILDALARRGIADNTWVIYTSDHGEMMGEHRLTHKRVFYDAAVKVPLILRPPGGAAPRIVREMVEHMDLAATIRAIAGGPPVPGSKAVDLLPAVAGADAGPFHDVIVSETCGFAMFRTATHKLVVHEDDASPGQLFDRREDPLEDRNLVDDPAQAAVLDDLMHDVVRPFLSRPPLRPHPTLVQRQGTFSPVAGGNR